jgi:hypothetical protein
MVEHQAAKCKNAIVLGDLVSDLGMVANIKCDNLLKIGFLNNLKKVWSSINFRMEI